MCASGMAVPLKYRCFEFSNGHVRRKLRHLLCCSLFPVIELGLPGNSTAKFLLQERESEHQVLL